MKSHLAIVVDEYGGTSGLVSLEDVIKKLLEISVMSLMMTMSILLKLMKKLSLRVK
jgi:Mg2+/Co2+ transporter CorB